MEANMKKTRAQELFEMLTDELHREAMTNAQERLASMFGVTLKPEGDLPPSPAVKKALGAFNKRLAEVKQENEAPAEKPKRVVSASTKRKLRKNLKKARAVRAANMAAAKRVTRKTAKKVVKKTTATKKK